MSEVDSVRFVALAFLIGVPTAFAWLFNGVEWAVQIATFAAVLQILMEVGVRE